MVPILKYDEIIPRPVKAPVGAIIPKSTSRTWVTKRGLAVRIKDMTDRHVMNVIECLRRIAHHQTLNRFCDDSIDKALKKGHPAYGSILREALKRGIEV